MEELRNFMSTWGEYCLDDLPADLVKRLLDGQRRVAITGECECCGHESTHFKVVYSDDAIAALDELDKACFELWKGRKLTVAPDGKKVSSVLRASE